MLSTAQPDDPSARSTDSSSVIPTDIDGEPIRLSSNPAHVEGTLYELGQFYARTGYFQSLISDGAVMLSNGRMAVDSLSAVAFVSGDVADPTPYTFENPCPGTPSRIQIFEGTGQLPPQTS